MQCCACYVHTIIVHICIRYRYYMCLKAPFISFNMNKRTDAGTILGQELLKEIAYCYLLNYLNSSLIKLLTQHISRSNEQNGLQTSMTYVVDMKHQRHQNGNSCGFPLHCGSSQWSDSHYQHIEDCQQELVRWPHQSSWQWRHSWWQQHLHSRLQHKSNTGTDIVVQGIHHHYSKEYDNFCHILCLC